MKRWVAALTAALFTLQSFAALAQTPPPAGGVDVRLYLADGSVVTGQMVSRSKDLIIVRVDNQVFTFDPAQVEKIVTPDSVGSGARTVSVTEFPYISFLGGTVAFGFLSYLQFDNAADKDKDAKLNESLTGDTPSLAATAKKFRDKADRARLFGWSSALLAAGSLGIALYPHKTTRRVFPELSIEQGTPALVLSYSF